MSESFDRPLSMDEVEAELNARLRFVRFLRTKKH